MQPGAFDFLKDTTDTADVILIEIILLLWVDAWLNSSLLKFMLI